MSDQSVSIQKRLQRIRTRIIFLGSGTLLGLLLLLVFIPIDEKVQASGRVRAERESYIRSSVDGILKTIEVREGQEIAKGAVLARLDSTDQEGTLRNVEARIVQARAELKLRQRKLETVLKLPLPKEFWHIQEDYEIARKKKQQTEVDLERVLALGETGAVSKHYIENAQLQVALSSAEFKKAENNVGIVEKGLEKTILNEARAEVQTAQENLKILEVERRTLVGEIERHVVRAPEEGIVTLVFKRTPGEHCAKGDELFHLSHGPKRLVNLFATEREYHRIKPGQKVLMSSPAFNQLRYGYIEGTVLRTAIESEELGGTGRAYRIVVKVDRTPQPLMLGASIDAEIVLQRAPLWRLLVPVKDESVEGQGVEDRAPGRPASS